MDIDAAARLILESGDQGRYYPEQLRGALDFATALRVQLEVLDLRLARGERQAGWKIGLTSPSVRAGFGTDQQPFGYLMAEGVHHSGDRVALASVAAGCGLEPELCWTLGVELAGPGAGPGQARRAVSAVCAGMEINERRAGGVQDFGLAIADNLTQWGIVVGECTSPVPDAFDSDSLAVTMHCDGELVADVVGADVIDDHFVSLATLANVLAEHGRRLEAGQRVITGSFSKHDVTAPGRWQATFSGVGACILDVVAGDDARA